MPALLAVLVLGGVAGAPAAAATDGARIPGQHLEKSGTNLCLVAFAGPGERPVEQTPCGEYTNQGWYLFFPWAPNMTYFQIRHMSSGKCVVARGTGESKAVTTTCDETFDSVWVDQLWYEVGEARWGGSRFHNVNSGLCLAGRGTAQAIQTTCGDWRDQVWHRG
jgi:hypothetical protein